MIIASILARGSELGIYPFQLTNENSLRANLRTESTERIDASYFKAPPATSKS